MPRHWTRQFSYVTGVPRDAAVGAVALVSDELAAGQIEHTVPMIWSGGRWLRASAERLDFTTVSMAVVPTPLRQAVYLGLHGNVFFIGAGDEHEEVIDTPDGAPERLGMMRGLRTIAGQLYAVGMRRQVYRRDNINLWTDLGTSARPRPEDDTVRSFEAIDGFEPSEIYAVGREGEIWQFDGRIWHQAASPTNVVLTGVCCGGDGVAYACGRLGILLRGRGDRWEIVQHEVTSQDFWGIAWLDGRLYLATSYQIFHFENDILTPVAFGTDTPRSCFHVQASAEGNVLWSIGAKDVMAFDGASWTRID